MDRLISEVDEQRSRGTARYWWRRRWGWDWPLAGRWWSWRRWVTSCINGVLFSRTSFPVFVQSLSW